MCAEFQRISSAVEGCNGYLSRLHHANRGFTEQSLKVLKTIHNFDLKRDDELLLRNVYLINHFLTCLSGLFLIWVTCPEQDVH